MTSTSLPLPPLKSVKVLDQLRERIRHLHDSIRTEEVYVHWVRAFVRFDGLHHPANIGGGIHCAGFPARAASYSDLISSSNATRITSSNAGFSAMALRHCATAICAASAFG